MSPEPISSGSCHACGMTLSGARLRALLRRRALERLLEATTDVAITHAQLAEALTRAGFPTSRLTVTKDLQLLGTIRVAEVRYQLTHHQVLRPEE